MPVYYPPASQAAPASPVDPDADLKQSPLWPLQQSLRQVFTDAVNKSEVTPAQIGRVTTPRNEVESQFKLWRNYDSATKLRSTIEALLDPNYLDVADDPLLSALQVQILNVPQWKDVLPT